MKSSEDETKVVEGNLIEEQSGFLHGEKWSLAKQGTLDAALDAFLPYRNVPYKAQLAGRSKELDQTLDDIMKRSEDASAKDTKYAKKPPIKKPPLEDIIPMIPNVGYERNVTVGLEKDGTGKIHAGIRVLYVKNGENYRFLLPLSECSNVAPQIVKAAEATAAFLTQQKFDVSDGVKNCKDLLGLKFTMNAVGEIIMSLVLVIDSDAPPKTVADAANGEKIENVMFYMPGGVKRQLREFFFKSGITGQIKEHIEKYTPALKTFVEDNRARLGVVGIYITWHDAKNPPEVKPSARPWYHVAGDERVTETVNSVKLDLFPHLETIHPSRTQAITTIVNTIVDGLSLQTRSSVVFLISEFYVVPNLISQKCKQTAVLESLQKPLQAHLKEKRKHNILFISSQRGSRMKLFQDHAPEALIHWGKLRVDEAINRILFLHRQRPSKIAWVIDTSEDSADSGGNKCSNADLLERNHKMLYPYYTLERVVGIDVGPQKSEKLTLVAFYKKNADFRTNPVQVSESRDNAKGGPRTESKVPNHQAVRVPDTKRKAPDQQRSDSVVKVAPNQRGPGVRNEMRGDAQKRSKEGRRNHPEGPSGTKRPRRGGSPQAMKRGSSRHSSYPRAREPVGPGARLQNPWASNNSFDRPMAASSQTAPGVMSQLTSVIGKQLLLAQMNSALQLTSSSVTDDMMLYGMTKKNYVYALPSVDDLFGVRRNRGAAGDRGGHDWAPRENDDIPPLPVPPPPPRQLPAAPPRSRTGDASFQYGRQASRSAVREGNAQENFGGASRSSGEDISRDKYRSAPRQEFSSHDFWNTPLEDLTSNKFKSASPTQEKMKSSNASGVAARSTSKDEFPREDYKSSSHPLEMTRSYFRSADQDDFRSMNPTWEHVPVRDMSPDNENYTHGNRGATQGDFVHVDYRSAAQEDVISKNLRGATRESSTRGYTRWAAQDESTNNEFRSAPWKESERASENLRGATRESSTRGYTRWAAQDESTNNEFRSAPWKETEIASENVRGTTRESSARGYTRGAAQDEFTNNEFRSAPWEESEIAHQGNFTRSDFESPSRMDSRSAVRRDFTYDDFRSTTREDVTPRSDSRKAAHDDSTHSDFRGAAWEDARSASREASHKDTWRAARSDFNGAARGSFRSASREDSYNVEPRDNSLENLSRDEFFSSHNSFGRGLRDSFDSSGRNSLGDENSSFRGGNTGNRYDIGYTNTSGRFGRDRDAWGGDITRRKY